MRKLITFGLAVTTAAAVAPVTAAAQEDTTGAVIRVGEPAPPLTITEYLNGPVSADRNIAAQGSDWQVVEFWAAWCPACVAGIPHMNELVDELGDEGFVFLTLSADSREILQRTFFRRPTRTLVARDEGGATARRYRIGGYPQAVVIDPQGVIRALANPGDLTPANLRALAAGDGSAVPTRYYSSEPGLEPDWEWDEKASVDEDAPEIYSQVVLRRSPLATRGYMRHLTPPGKILGDGIDLKEMILFAYDVDDLRADYRLPPAPELYRLSVVSIDPSRGGARRLLRNSLEASFNFEPRWERRPTDVVVVRRLPDFGGEDFRKSGETTGERMGMAGKAAFYLNAAPIDWIMEVMGQLLFDRPVVDETGLEGNFDVAVEWGEPTFERIAEAFRAAGLEFLRERREIVFLVVEPGA